MGRRRTNARPSRNQLRDLHQMREQMACGDRRVDLDLDDDLDGMVSDLEDPEEAARAEIAAFLASQDA